MAIVRWIHDAGKILFGKSEATSSSQAQFDVSVAFDVLVPEDQKTEVPRLEACRAWKRVRRRVVWCGELW